MSFEERRKALWRHGLAETEDGLPAHSPRAPEGVQQAHMLGGQEDLECAEILGLGLC
ncbi:hypothetical protein TPA0906_34190 [Streptomyces olivaceus]|nr:hypothetical protein TPA0906_34190 [Streptomyces olivaceus]